MSTSSLPTVPSTDTSLTEMGTYEGSAGPIKLFGFDGKPLAETPDWKLYAAKIESLKGQMALMKISSTIEGNAVLNWEEYVLIVMQLMADDIDAGTHDTEVTPKHGVFFPRIHEKIDTDDGRVALVLSFHPSILSYRELKPLSAIPSDKRIDLKTSMWILGKSLKLATFFHEAGVSIGNVGADNVFITQDNLEVHGVFYFDFSYAEMDPDPAIFVKEISEMAKTVWFACGGTETTEPPLDADIMNPEQHQEYVANLKRMMDGTDVSGARVEMDHLYEINDRIWPKEPIKDGPNSRGQTMKRQFHYFRLLGR